MPELSSQISQENCKHGTFTKNGVILYAGGDENNNDYVLLELNNGELNYKWNVDGSNGEGFIAHELAEVVPQCVTGEKDAVDANGNPKYQGIDTSFLVATLTAAIQEQQAIIESLKARLDAANL
jgi:hypothetical protein